MPNDQAYNQLNDDIRQRLVKDHAEWLRERCIVGVVLVAFQHRPEGTLALLSCIAYGGVKGTELLEPALTSIEEGIRAKGKG